MRVKECLNANLFSAISTAFQLYLHDIDSEKYPSVHLFPDSTIALLTYNHSHGELLASDLALEYKNGEINTTTIVAMFRLLYFRNWKRLYDLELAEFNPLWNVEGSETRTIITEQLVDGHNNVTHGKSQTSEQIDDGVVTTSEYGYNSQSATNTVKNTTDGGKTKLTDSGTTNTTTSLGKTKSVDEFVRGGNIGTTKTTEMFNDTVDLFNNWNFIERIFSDISKEFTYLIY